MIATRINAIFAVLNAPLALADEGLTVSAPATGELLATLAVDTAPILENKIIGACVAQHRWAAAPRSERAALLEALSAALKEHREMLTELITFDTAKTAKEAQGEVDGAADIILKTLKDATLPDFNGMLRRKERPPVGILGLITSFNFPLVVANWNIAPALLAGNAVLWKPSEKTPLVALAYKALFDKVAGEQRGLMQLLIGNRDIGEALVAHERVDMISATGSVGMGKGIKTVLATKKNNAIAPILELGGNNGVIVSDKITPEHLGWTLQSLLNSFLGTSGQRCTNTRRVFVQRSQYEKLVDRLVQKLEYFIASGVIQNPLLGTSNEYGYGPLIDEDVYQRFEHAKQQTLAEGGTVLLGQRLLAQEQPHAYYVAPALALLPSHTDIMHSETFAPLLYIVPYDEFDQAIAMLNAPDNAGLVNGIYTLSQREADDFAAANEAGHSVINSPKGTGTPAYGMGFGGNKSSGEGEILYASDPLRPFTRDERIKRIAQNKDITMELD